MKDDFKRARQAIGSSKNVVVLTGAGISAESGVPTFRGKDGLWKNFRAEELATLNAFRSDPKTVWEWYDWRRSLIKGIKPNLAHYALVTLERTKESFAIVTQNVDGLHRLAGSVNIHELHGNIWRVRCTKCGEVSFNYDVPIKILPRCANCSGLLRPDVVWFGESLDPLTLQKSTELLGNSDLTVVVGTSGIVQPAASMAMYAKSQGSMLLEINVDKTPDYQFADFFFLGKAGEILPRLVE